MNGNGAIDQAAGQGGAGAVGGGSGEGNQRLNEAFDYAIREASQTLSITTKKGADLYALKQRPQ
ncbi:MAG: hypothetical protein AAF412_13650 [Pseudomonadota bacterium]